MEAYRQQDADYERSMAEDDREDAIIEQAIEDLNTALNSTMEKTRNYCIRCAINKLQDIFNPCRRSE